MQRVDMWVNGRLVNTNQKSDYPPFVKRMNLAIQNAQEVLVRRTGFTPPPKPPTPIPEKPPTNLNAKYVVFCAEEPQNALSAPKKFTIAFSADHSYRYPTETRPGLDLHQIIADVKAAGHRTAGWCDCRESDGTSAAVGVQFVKEYGLDYFIGQAEHDYEFDNAVAHGATVVVGNITALRSDQLEKIQKGEVALIQEDYWNEGWARANSVLISAYCAGVYKGSWQPSIIAYKQAGRWRDGDGIYYARPDLDWGNLT